MDSWEGIKMFYKKIFDIPERVIEYVAVISILSDCVCGYANYKIAKRHKVSIEYVSSIIMEFFSFDGWKVDLDISPIAVYNKTKGNFLMYECEMRSISNISDLNIVISFNVCRIYKEMKKMIGKYYDYS